MIAVLIALSLLTVLVAGIVIGLVWRGLIVIGDRRSLYRLTSQLETERRMAAATYASLQAMRQAARGSWEGGGRQ